MRFDEQNTHSCLIASVCDNGSVAPGVDPRCSDASFCLANPDICGTECGSTVPCSDPDYRATHLTECSGDDPRCSDPAFAFTNPALCLNTPTLILKPEYVTREVGKSVQYTAVLLLGGEEVELTEGVTFASGDTSTAVIGSSAGNATGLSLGIVTISAQYGTLYAFAQLEVVAEGACDSRTNHFALLLDHSKSSAGVFSAMTASRLALAKKQASLFADSVNLNKDSMGLMSFDADSAELLGFISSSTDLPLLKTAINGIAVNSLGRTNIAHALAEAKAFLQNNAPSGSLRCVLLFSDGENNEGTDPIAVANAMKAEGYVIFVLGLRAKGNAFRMLDRIATGGFFINALTSNESQVEGWLTGLKGYICSGNCEPDGGEVLGQGQLNFSAFTNWIVTAGHVDLIGHIDGAPELYDLRPGNGLYVDLCGSVVGTTPDLGTMKMRNILTWTAATLYNVTLRLAGNSREDKQGTVLVQAYTSADVLIDSQTFVIAGLLDFDDYVFQFTSVGTQGYIVVSQQALSPGANKVFGNLWDGVVITKDSDDSVLFSDDFDGENESLIPLPCETSGTPSLDGFSYDCYSYGCLSSPIPVQTPDPSPLPDLESP